MISLILLALTLLTLVPKQVLAAWTPLVALTDFDGIKTDVLTTSAGIVAVLLIIVGIGLLVRVLGR